MDFIHVPEDERKFHISNPSKLTLFTDGVKIFHTVSSLTLAKHVNTVAIKQKIWQLLSLNLSNGESTSRQ